MPSIELLKEKRKELCVPSCKKLYVVHQFHKEDCPYRKWAEEYCKEEEQRNGGTTQ